MIGCWFPCLSKTRQGNTCTRHFVKLWNQHLTPKTTTNCGSKSSKLGHTRKTLSDTRGLDRSVRMRCDRVIDQCACAATWHCLMASTDLFSTNESTGRQKQIPITDMKSSMVFYLKWTDDPNFESEKSCRTKYFSCFSWCFRLKRRILTLSLVAPVRQVTTFATSDLCTDRERDK